MDAERREYLEMQLSAYLDGELMPQERAEVEAWLEADPAARQLLGHLRATVDAVHSLPRARASEELLGNLRTRLERKALLDSTPSVELAPGTRTRSWSRWVAVAAVIALTFTAGYFTWTLREQESPRTELAFNESKPRGARSAGAPSTEDRLASQAEGSVKDKKAEFEESIPSPSVAARPPAGPPAAPVVAAADEGRSEGRVDEVMKEAPGKPGTLGEVLIVNGTLPAIAGVQVDDTSAKSALEDISSLAARQDSDAFDGDGLADARKTADTSVLAMSFADADSRARVIDALTWEVQMGQAGEQAKRLKHPDLYVPARKAGESAAELRAARAAPATGVPETLREPAPPQKQAGGARSPKTDAPAERAYDHVMSEASGSAPTVGAIGGMGGWGGGGMGGMGGYGLGGMGGMMGGMGLEANGVVQLDSIEGDRSSPVNVIKMNVTDPAAADRIVAVLNARARAGGATIVDESVRENLALPARRGASRGKVATDESIGTDWSSHVWMADGDVITGGAGTDTLRRAPQSQPARSLGIDGVPPGSSILADRYRPEEFRYSTEVGKLFERDQPANAPAASMNGALHRDFAAQAASRPATERTISSFDSLDLNLDIAATPARKDEMPEGEAAAGSGMGGRTRASATTSPAVAAIASETKWRDSGKEDGGASGGVTGRRSGYLTFDGYEHSFAAPATRPASAALDMPATTNLLVVYVRVLSPESQPAVPAASSAPASAPATSQPAGPAAP